MGNLVMLPVPGLITQDWLANKTGGITPDPNGTPMQQLVARYGNYQDAGHDGLDQDGRTGDPIVAPGSGRVDYAGPGELMPADMAAKWGFIYGPGGWGSGNITLLDHGLGFGTYHAHQSRVHAPTGAWLEAGQLLGYVGNTGRSGGDHLHWSLVAFPVNYQDPLYSRRNPLQYLPAGITIPYTGGGKGAPDAGRRTLCKIPGIYI